jgi:hypothetical protein
MISSNFDQHRMNIKKSFDLASALFPLEEWIHKENNIWVAKSRLRNTSKERAKLAWEIEQVRVFITPDSAVCFLPELENEDNLGKLSADTVIDGEIVEIKTVTGTRTTLGTEFRKGYKQGAYLCEILPEIKAHSVFIPLFSNLSPGSVKAKIAGELKNRTDEGRFICYFETSSALYSWTYDELRGIIKNHPALP